MPLLDVLRAALSRPAGRVVEAPVRDIVHEILRDHGFVGPAEVARLRGELAELKDRVTALEARLRDLTPDT
jgi:polyhydroxyalkanoate synthesis regulator phasin